jgi:hypothetical protein
LGFELGFELEEFGLELEELGLVGLELGFESELGLELGSESVLGLDLRFWFWRRKLEIQRKSEVFSALQGAFGDPLLPINSRK